MWKTIETAPKDRDILLLIDWVVIQGRWSKQYKYWEVASLSSHGCGCCAGENNPPTHWMDIPELPQ